MSPERVEELQQWLLPEAGLGLEAMKHPWSQPLDAQGQSWHVFHRDGQRMVFRQRPLDREGGRGCARRRGAGLALIWRMGAGARH